MAAAMQEDVFLVEAAFYGQYYEQARECIQAVQEQGLACSPPEEILDDPRLFKNWLDQCRQAGQRARF